ERALYYPPIPVLQELSSSTNSVRIIGNGTFPPLLSAMYGLRDVRGYDAVDPQRFVELLSLGTDTNSPRPTYATTQFLKPLTSVSRSGDLILSPVLDLMGVSHVIYRGNPTPNTSPAFVGPDYWVLQNRNALPRAFVPRSVQAEPRGSERLH